MKTFYPKEHPVPFVHQLLLSGVAPRPIALVGTLDSEGRRNLSPFSFFNAFGANPPVICVSPSNRGTDGTPKHTLLNILETKEFTVSAVSYSMVEQINLASANYPVEVDEFAKAGLSALKSDLIAPPGVAESPFVMECRLLQHVDTGGKPASGNLLIAEVVAFHVRESVYYADKIDPGRLDLVARMGHDWYCRAGGASLFELAKPKTNGIGFDALPSYIRESVVLTGNDLAKLAGEEAIPDIEPILRKWKRDIEAVNPFSGDADLYDVELSAGNPRGALLNVIRCIKSGSLPVRIISARLHRCCSAFLKLGEHGLAWECALISDEFILEAIMTGKT